jgi:hypothetical protein
MGEEMFLSPFKRKTFYNEHYFNIIYNQNLKDGFRHRMDCFDRSALFWDNLIAL